MLIIKSFKNYEEFKELFGVVEHGNGAMSRKNKILLACLKDRKFLHFWRNFCDVLREDGVSTVDNIVEKDYLHAVSMSDLKKFIKFYLDMIPEYYFNRTGTVVRLLRFEGIDYKLCSRKYKLDNMRGVCTDGDTRAVRYVNTESGRVFNMKGGKFISSIIEESRCTRVLPEQAKRWIGEEFAREWQSYATRFCGDRFELHVDERFDDIYSYGCCKGDFGSCMQGGCHADFYRNAVDCKAAYLTNEDEEIVARCIVFTDVYDDEGNQYRLAERQYASEKSDVLKQVLVDRLIAEGEIDGYKAVGADCHDNKNFVTNDGKSLKDKTLHIRCSLVTGDTLSYQDSFVYYDETNGIAYNDTSHGYDSELDSTKEVFASSDAVWSEYEGEYIPNDEAVRDEWYDDYILEEDSCHLKTNGCCYTSCRGRLENNDDYVWSDFEDAFLKKEEAVDVGGDYEYDWRLQEDCVEDIGGIWRLILDCEFSDVFAGYILKEEAVWSEHNDSFLPKDQSVFCEKDNDWQLEDDAVYSDMTERFYLSEDSRLEDEEIYKKKHALACV